MNPVLDGEELAALRSAMEERQRGPQRAARAAGEAVAIALIADDRTAERARPDGVKLGQRWGMAARTRVARLCGARLEVQRVAAEIVDGAVVREELQSSWTRGLALSGRPGLAVVAVRGPLVTALAARLLGTEEAGDGARPPSATTLCIFTPIGDALVAAVMDSLHDEQGCNAERVAEAARVDAWRRTLANDDVIVAITLHFGGTLTGTARLVARPETLVPPAPPARIIPAQPGAIERALGGVPVEVRVELGRAQLTMGELAALQPGTLLPLLSHVDHLLPVRAGGVIKAVGRPIATGGTVAVEIVDPASVHLERRTP